MRHRHRVGFVAVGVAAVVLVAGCSDGGEPAEKGIPGSSVSSVEPEPGISAPMPLSDEEQVDAKAEEEGWIPEEAAGAYVADICASLPQQKKFGNPAEWLMMRTDAEHGKVLMFGVPLLCPKWEATVAEALGGKVQRSYSDGTYRVKADAGTNPELIEPGTYRTSGKLEGCYWERTSKGGDIVDNQHATAASEITVTVAGSDGSFTSEGCGVWRPVQ